MEQVVIASSADDARAAEAVERHHAELAGSLEALVQPLVAAAAAGERERAEEARSRLLRWCEEELLPHAAAEEHALYPAAHARPEGRLLIDGMITEHHVLTGLIRDLGATIDPVRAAATATALQVTFANHVGKENELVLPMLSAAPEVRLADLLHAMHEQIEGEARESAHATSEPTAATASGDSAPASSSSTSSVPSSASTSPVSTGASGHDGHRPGGHVCGCGERPGDGFPELDARAIPHAIRHATIFGALETVLPGGGLILIAPHDPLPLLAQVRDRYGDRFEVSYLERGPEVWRLSFVHQSPDH